MSNTEDLREKKKYKLYIDPNQNSDSRTGGI